MRTKKGSFKDYVLKLQRSSLILSRPESSKKPLLVYPLLQLNCSLSTEAQCLELTKEKATYQDCQVIALTKLGGGTRRVYFENDEDLYDCLLHVRHYTALKRNLLS